MVEGSPRCSDNYMNPLAQFILLQMHGLPAKDGGATDLLKPADMGKGLFDL